MSVKAGVPVLVRDLMVILLVKRACKPTGIVGFYLEKERERLRVWHDHEEARTRGLRRVVLDCCN